jgi:hypothetical protein
MSDLKRAKIMARHKFAVLVEGPEWGDAKFYGEWLLAAAKAESLWKEALGDQDFAKKVERVSVCYIPDFGIAATMMLMRLKSHWTRFVIDVDSEEGEELAMMFGMGFFAQRYRSYQMTLPSCVTAEKVREAVLEYAKTEDEDFVTHPERILAAMPFADATALLHRLGAMDEFIKFNSRCLGRA